MSTRIKFGLPLAIITAMFSIAIAQTGANFTETLSGLSGSAKTLDMVFVNGGAFDMGCSGSPSPACGQNESPVRRVTVSDFYIGKYEVTRGQWKAVMGSAPESYSGTDNNPVSTIDWYHAQEFVCELNKKTGKKYRLATEAEWEFAARGGTLTKNTRYSGGSNADNVAWHQGNAKPTCFSFGGGSPVCMEDFKTTAEVGEKTANELGVYDMSGNVREWVYDAWAQGYPSGDEVNPTGAPIIHIQKIRRGGSYMGPSSEATVTGRKIRSIEGADGDLGFRLALSTDPNTVPEGMTAPCDIQRPPVSQGKGTLRDDRLITGNDYVWVNEMNYNGMSFSYILKIWEDGSAVYKPAYGSNVSGEWATGNDFSLYIMNSSGTRTKFIYYVVSEKMEITLMLSNDMPNRWEYKKAAEVSGAASLTKPSIANPKTPDQIVPAGSVVDMADPPTNGKDSRLIVATSLGSGQAWLQDNVALGAGGTHRYRFDYTPDTARFVVWDNSMGSSVIISSGKWFTIDNTFLRITGSNGRKYDYLYSVTDNGNTHYHISFQGYERGDFRVFEKAAVPSGIPNWSEPTMEPYANNDNGGSTYEPPSSEPKPPTSIREKNIITGTNSLIITGRMLNIIALSDSKVKIRVVNLAGKTVASLNTMGMANLPLLKIPAGVYIIEAKIDGHKITRSTVLR